MVLVVDLLVDIVHCLYERCGRVRVTGNRFFRIWNDITEIKEREIDIMRQETSFVVD